MFSIKIWIISNCFLNQKKINKIYYNETRPLSHETQERNSHHRTEKWNCHRRNHNRLFINKINIFFDKKIAKIAKNAKNAKKMKKKCKKKMKKTRKKMKNKKRRGYKNEHHFKQCETDSKRQKPDRFGPSDRAGQQY